MNLKAENNKLRKTVQDLTMRKGAVGGSEHLKQMEELVSTLNK